MTEEHRNGLKSKERKIKIKSTETTTKPSSLKLVAFTKKVYQFFRRTIAHTWPDTSGTLKTHTAILRLKWLVTRFGGSRLFLRGFWSIPPVIAVPDASRLLHAHLWTTLHSACAFLIFADAALARNTHCAPLVPPAARSAVLLFEIDEIWDSAYV